MSEIHEIRTYGILPYLSEDLLKQVKYAKIKTREGKIAYLLSLGAKARKPRIMEGAHEARGALKWISEILSSDGQSGEIVTLFK